MEGQHNVDENNTTNYRQHESEAKNACSIDVGLSKLQNTLTMLESNDAGHKNAISEDQEDKHDKNARAKAKKNREVNELEDNNILQTRLRSESGCVYSSGLMVDSPNITTFLDPILEAHENTAKINMPVRKQQPCSDNECCKNTAKIVNMIAELQQSVNEIKTASDQQVMVSAGHAGNISRVEDQVCENTSEIKALDEEMTDYKFQLRLLTNIVIRQDQQIAMLSRKINDAQQREMYPNLVITGITEKDNENPIQAYNQFIQDQLGIQELIPVHRAY